MEVAALFADSGYLTARLRLGRSVRERPSGYSADDDAFFNERLLVIDEVSRTCAVWPEGAPITRCAARFEALWTEGSR
jgi:hypothetical protein